MALICIGGCKHERDPSDRQPSPAPAAACTRAAGEKLGVPFVRVCPEDLPGVITAPFWISAAPIGCGAGARGPCPPILALAPGDDVIEAQTAQMIEATLAHRLCALRFGGRLPTIAERAQAHDALGLDTLVVTEPGDRSRELGVLAEWATEIPCLDPSTISEACRPTSYPATATRALVWSELRSCRAVAGPVEGALIVQLGERCPPIDRTLPPCLLGSRATQPGRAYAIECRALAGQEAAHPEPPSPQLAAFRCLVPEATLAGTIR